MPSDPSRLIPALARDQINLDLKTLDLCFLAGLYLRADRASLASFEEECARCVWTLARAGAHRFRSALGRRA